MSEQSKNIGSYQIPVAQRDMLRSLQAVLPTIALAALLTISTLAQENMSGSRKAVRLITNSSEQDLPLRAGLLSLENLFTRSDFEASRREFSKSKIDRIIARSTIPPYPVTLNKGTKTMD